MARAKTIGIEVAYARPDRQERVRLRLPRGATLRQAVEASGLLRKYPELDLGQAGFGIYAKLCPPDTPLSDRDRVEIYRPLIADPKEVRRRRAAEGKAMKNIGG